MMTELEIEFNSPYAEWRFEHRVEYPLRNTSGCDSFSEHTVRFIKAIYTSSMFPSRATNVITFECESKCTILAEVRRKICNFDVQKPQFELPQSYAS
jgi:hypothetical protein